MRRHDMRGIAGILDGLQPVAWDDRQSDLPIHPFEHVGLPSRQKWRRTRTEIGEDKPAQFFDRISLDLYLVLVGAVRVGKLLERLFDALAALIIEPAVVCAAQPAFVGNAEHHSGLAMRAMR